MILIGDPGVGKTLLTEQFVNKKVTENNVPTVGVEFSRKVKPRLNKIVELKNGRRMVTTIWDTAGQEMYKSMTRIHYKDCDGAILVFDLTRKKTFENCMHWIEEFKMYSQKKTQVMLMGNKLDLVQADSDMREINLDEAQALARMEGFLYKEVSAVTAKNVDDAFIELLQEIYVNYNRTGGEKDEGVPLRATSFADHGSEVKNLDKGGCC